MTTTVLPSETLPRWDLDSLFPGPESPEFTAALEHAGQEIAALEEHFDREQIGGSYPGATEETVAALLEETIDQYNAALDLATRLEGYLYCLVTADVRDEAAAAANSAWRQRKVGLSRLAPRFSAWVGLLDLDTLAERSAVVREHLRALRRIKTAASHLMPPGEEDLAAALGPSGAAAWVTLRDDLAGRASARVEIDGEEQELPLSEIANLAYHEVRDVRHRAYLATKATWQDLALPMAAAINGVKGQQLTLAQRRGWDDPLDQAAFANAIDRPTLDALHAAITEGISDFRRYLRAKAHLLGLETLAGYDLFAPVGEAAPWPYETARGFIVETISAESPRMGEFAERCFRESWIDAEPREGKDGGGFSIGVGGDASRIFMNYLPVYDGMSILAHEIGHSYHNMVSAARGRTPLQTPPDDVPAPASFPMTLAETASTLCEALVQRAARKDVTPAQEAALLDGWLVSFATLVFGTHAWFLLERSIFAQRGEREISPAELDEMMAAGWREVAGDALEPGTVASHEWTKPHFFIEDVAYYNFPYAFGVLFAVGLLAERDRNPSGFYDRLDDLLADSGMATAPELASRFGIDLHDPAFWRTSLDSFRADVTRLEELAREIG